MKINDIWFTPILKIIFEVFKEFYHDFKNVHNKIVLWKLPIIVLLRTTGLLMSNPVKNPARFVGWRSGSRFRPEFPFRPYTVQCTHPPKGIRVSTTIHTCILKNLNNLMLEMVRNVWPVRNSFSLWHRIFHNSFPPKVCFVCHEKRNCKQSSIW